MENIKFSVIVPVFNGEKFIDNCLISIIEQTYTNLELIVVDDGSTDSSLKKCEIFADNDQRVKLLKQHNEGPNKARNLGISVCTGNYLIFVDADDYIETTTLEVLFNKLKNYRYDIVNYGYDFLDLNTGNVLEKKSNLEQTFFGDKILELALQGDLISGVCWNKCIKSELVSEHKIYFIEDKMHARDIIFTRKIASKSNSCLIIPDVLYHSTFRQHSFSRSFGVKNIQSAIDFSIKHFTCFAKADNEKMLHAVEYSVGKHLRYILFLSAFRSVTLNEHFLNYKIVRQSPFEKLLNPTYGSLHYFRLRDYMMLIITKSACLSRVIALLMRQLGIVPY